MATKTKDYVEEDARKIPGPVEERIKRGRARMTDDKPKRQECLRFWRGDQYVYRAENLLVSQSTITTADGRGKPRHRVRTTRNLIVDIVAHEVAAATQRVPDYEVNPSTTDPEDVGAARLGEKVARYGYDKWSLRQKTAEIATYSVVTGEGFAWPYWDSSVGPYFADQEGNILGQGEVCVGVFGPNEVFWEPGLQFDESRWHGIEQAMAPEEVVELEGYIGGNPKPDAESDGGQKKLCLVTQYLERPCPKYPKGRWLTMAEGKQIVAERPFPCVDEQGNPVDEPVLHRLSYFTDPDEDRDMGLVKHLLDAQRTYNDCTNKQLEWKNLALNPQVIIQNGEFAQQLTDEPGAVFHATGSGEIIWRPVPPVPSELSAIKEEAKVDMAQIAAQNDIPSAVTSARGIQALIEKDQNRRQPFIADLAEFHSRLMRHCLYLVQRHYTEERLLKVRGRFGPELVSDFLGAQLRGQADVTVLPGSIEPRTREAIEQKILAFADRGWISPEAAMAAINGGTAETLVESYELDVARANLMIQKIKAGPEALFGQPPRLENGQEVPAWMPRPFDNVAVHKAVFADWMKTQEFDTATPDVQEAAQLYYAGCEQIEQQQAFAAAQMQTAMAEQQGMQNAARPQDGKPMPDQPGIGSDQSSPS